LSAHDGPNAHQILAHEAPVDLLFTDVVMPGMSGRELADAARELYPDLKVLFTSGYTRNAIVHGGRLDPGVELIAKPFTYQALAEKIAEVLDAGSSGRLLVVEEDATLRMFAVEALEAAGYHVHQAATAGEAMGMVRASGGRYDAVFATVSLPDKSGEAFAREVRALHDDLPILIGTADDVTATEARFTEDRCIAVIQKPYNASMLQAALERLNVRCARS
jgi:CheY-like chemotaxis protein